MTTQLLFIAVWFEDHHTKRWMPRMEMTQGVCYFQNNLQGQKGSGQWIKVGEIYSRIHDMCSGVRSQIFFFNFILLYNTVLVLPYISMNPPWVHMSSQSWTSLPPPSPYHLSGSSQCTSPKQYVNISYVTLWFL